MPNGDSNDLRKRKRRPKAGDLGALKRVLWEAVREVEKLLAAESIEAKLRAASTIATLGGTYLKCLQAADLEARIQALEARLAQERSDS